LIRDGSGLIFSCSGRAWAFSGLKNLLNKSGFSWARAQMKKSGFESYLVKSPSLTFGLRPDTPLDLIERKDAFLKNWVKTAVPIQGRSEVVSDDVSQIGLRPNGDLTRLFLCLQVSIVFGYFLNTLPVFQMQSSCLGK
jgi:hypothetical protein